MIGSVTFSQCVCSVTRLFGYASVRLRICSATRQFGYVFCGIQSHAGTAGLSRDSPAPVKQLNVQVDFTRGAMFEPNALCLCPGHEGCCIRVIDCRLREGTHELAFALFVK